MFFHKDLQAITDFYDLLPDTPPKNYSNAHDKFDQYIFVLIDAGNGTLKLKNREYPIEPNTTVVIHPNEPHTVTFKDVIRIMYIAFDRYEIANYLKIMTETHIYKSISPENLKPTNTHKDNLGKPLPFYFPTPVFKDSYELSGLLRKTHALEHLDVSTQENRVFLDELSFILFQTAYSIAQINQKAVKHNELKNLPFDIKDRLSKICDFIQENLNKEISIGYLAELVNVEASTFIKQFKEYLHITPYQYILEKRLERSNYLLTNTSLPMQQIAMEAGFSSLNSFEKALKRKFNASPSEIRQRKSS